MILSLSQIGVVFLVSFAAVLFAGPSIINFLTGLKMRQTIGVDAPQPDSHKVKSGTPTMGGILFVVGIAAAMLVGYGLGWLKPDEPSAIRLAVITGVFILHMALGFLDDYLKVTRGKAMGLKARHKLIGQLVIALLFVIYLTQTAVPGVTTAIGLGGGRLIELSPWVYYPIVVFLMIGLSNCANLTDGLDGLAAGLALLAFIGLAMTTFSGAPEIAFFGWALAGACLGFLIYNGYPARVFMGDAGSLAIGATAAAMAVMGKEEIPLLLFFMVFIVETVSVIIQVVSFKTRGKRVFKMAPLHHHFEQIGWREVQVVQRFWIAGAVMLWLGLMAASTLSPSLSGPIW